MKTEKIINAAGKMTTLGSSASSSTIADALSTASKNFYVIEELYDHLNDLIVEKTGAEAGVPTCSASAGIVLAIAGLISGDSLNIIEAIPFQNQTKEIILQKGHVISFGAPITQLIRLAGAAPIEVGTATNVTDDHLRGSINDKTAGILYVKSHHTVQEGMVSFDNCLNIAHENGLPLIVDAAAEEDLAYYISAGADLVVYSGSKALGGPSSGFIAGKRVLIENSRKNYSGIGRAMKIGKETLFGLAKALTEYEKEKLTLKEQQKWLEPIANIIEKVGNSKGLSFSLKKDEAGRKILRGVICFDKGSAITAQHFVEFLERGNNRIFTRSHTLALGYIQIDPRTITTEDSQIIADKINEFLGKFNE